MTGALILIGIVILAWTIEDVAKEYFSHKFPKDKE
jgi:hypothetical protein